MIGVKVQSKVTFLYQTLYSTCHYKNETEIYHESTLYNDTMNQHFTLYNSYNAVYLFNYFWLSSQSYKYIMINIYHGSNVHKQITNRLEHTGSGLGDSSVFRINQSKNKKRKQSYDISCIYFYLNI
jgi:hypothetical protein